MRKNNDMRKKLKEAEEKAVFAYYKDTLEARRWKRRLLKEHKDTWRAYID